MILNSGLYGADTQIETGRRGQDIRGTEKASALTAAVLIAAASLTLAARPGPDPEPPATVALPTATLDPTPEPTASAEPETPGPETPEPTTAPASAPRPPAAPRAPAPAPPPSTPAASAGSITAAFYYGLYPGGFNAGSRYTPSAGTYDSKDLETVRRHVASMRYGGMDAAIASWWGPGDYTGDKPFAVGLQAAEGTPFRWAIYYELEGPGQPNRSPQQLREHLSYIQDRYTSHPNYLRRDGRPVIFVWPDPDDRCEMVQRWREANTLGIHVVHKVFPGWGNCSALSDSWHQYAPVHPTIEARPWSFAVSPGFWHHAESSPRLARDPARFESNVRSMAAGSAPWKLVTTFNEWGEGTSVESAQEWSSASGHGLYMDILNRVLGPR